MRYLTRNVGLSLKKGRDFELIRDLDPIPAGVYQFHGEIEGIYYFSVGEKITFGIPRECKRYLSCPRDPRRVKQTSTDEFLDRYYELLSGVGDSSPLPFAELPFTLCAIDPSLARGFN